MCLGAWLPSHSPFRDTQSQGSLWPPANFPTCPWPVAVAPCLPPFQADPAKFPLAIFKLWVAKWINSICRRKDKEAVFWHLIHTSFFHPAFPLNKTGTLYLHIFFKNCTIYTVMKKKSTSLKLSTCWLSDYLPRNPKRQTTDTFLKYFLKNMGHIILVTSWLPGGATSLSPSGTTRNES